MRRAYRIEGASVAITATSRLHDTTATWRRVSGAIELDPDEPAREPRVELAVEMAGFEVGLGKRGVLGDLLDVRRHPSASFRLTRLILADGAPPGTRERALGVIGWRGVDVEIEADLQRDLSADRLAASLRFALELPRFGVRPPRVLGFEMDPRMAVVASLEAVAA